MELEPRSIQKERELLRSLKQYFTSTAVSRITAEDLLAYREKRAADGKAAVYINMEMGAIRRVLKRAKRWHLVAADIKPLKERHRAARILSPDEKLSLLRVAAYRSDWQVARCAAILALNTTMRSCEIRGLRWHDVDLLDRMLTIRKSKTEAGERVIPLNADALAAILELRERAKALFGNNLSPDWYVLPHAEGYANPDPNKPMKGWRTAWRNLTQAIECPECGQLQDPRATCRNPECVCDISKVKSSTARLRFHDLRHHAITELAESFTSDQTIMSIAGHVSPRMLAHYSHVRLEAKRKALDALSSGSSGGSYGTNNVTIARSKPTPTPQVIEQYGGPGPSRTVDLTLIRGAL